MTAGGDADEERDYRDARPRLTLQLRLVPVPVKRSNARAFQFWIGAMALAMLFGATMPFGQQATAVLCFAILAVGMVLSIAGHRLFRGRVLRLDIGCDRVVLESAKSRNRIALCPREELDATPRHAVEGSFELVTLELAVGSRRLTVGPAGTGYRWRLETKPGRPAQYDLEHAEWVALLEALALTEQAVLPELEE